ncbi:putative porin [Chryseolinea lacunae]|uniref:Porin n=1 Tax=Chryseolinea lacunae TaxID=2801331 RepID=A0ABS1KWM4_9BACT|nr:putative porin [Chryseolinea lacunae]MBL0743735.1 hypothetical protein [Chryseolinea lacunae]
MMNLSFRKGQQLFLRVHFLRPLLVLLFFVAAVFQATAQGDAPRRRGSRVIDDTTKQVYGPRTSKYYFEKDVFFNRPEYHRIDTAIRNFHRWTYVQQKHYFYQDLGNIGTSMSPIFYVTPEQIGSSSGFNTYDPYWEAESVRYYDTKSPYSNMRVTLGGKGRSTTKATFSRNITPQWNIGFDYRAILIDKQIQRQGKGDRSTRSTYYDIFTSFQSKDSTYRLFFNFRRTRHETNEYGGILQRDGFVYKDYFASDAQPNLHDALSGELRMNIHLHHEYKIGSALQLYHTFDRYRQGVWFTDILASEPENFFGLYVPIVEDTTRDNTKFKSVRNEVGIKGNLLKLFYNGYYAVRYVTNTNSNINASILQVPTTLTESYIGGRMSLRLDSIGEVGGWVEVQQAGNYRIEGSIKSKWFEASLKQMQYAPSFVMQGYRGAYNQWNNDFNNTNVTQLNGYVHYTTPVFSISPGLTFTTLNNYVYFRPNDNPGKDVQLVEPVQTTGGQVIVSPEIQVSLTLARHITFNSQFLYTRVVENSGDAIQLPAVFANAQLAYENIFFNGNLDMQGGAEFHFQSDYYANGYNVPLRQFYTQQSFVSPSFPLIDLFFSARIKRGRIFLKYNNLMQAFTQEGYMATPQYPGQRSILDFGFDWSFYD